MKKSITDWINSHQVETGAICVVILLMAAVAMTTTGNKPSLMGLNIQPMYNQAAFPSGPAYPIEEELAQSLAIEANFSNGKVNRPFETTVKTVNGVGVCTLGLADINPKIPGATFADYSLSQTGAKRGPQASGQFQATPTKADTYKIKFIATCNPASGDGPSYYTEKTFTWVVDPVKQDPVEPFEITGSFPNGTVGKEYSTKLFVTAGSQYTCTMALLGVKPPMSGVSFKKNIIGGPKGGSAEYTFRVTPKEAGGYAVQVSAACDPVGNVKMKSLYAEKEFRWKVVPVSNATTTSSFCLNPNNKPKLVPVYRLWSKSASDHLYTVSSSEKPKGYKSEGIAGYVFKSQVDGTVPIYRSYRTAVSAHYYSTSNDASKYGYADEGILGYAPKTARDDTMPWYRLKIGIPVYDYMATTNSKERSTALKAGYTNDGTIAYICTRNK